jgi:hypothetical protein
MRYYLLIIVFVIGGIVHLLIGFGEKRGWANFLIDNWLVNHLWGWLEELGMSKPEKQLWRKMKKLFEGKLPVEELDGECREILQKHAGCYEDSAKLDRSLVAELPKEIRKFFENYDYLRFYDDSGAKELDAYDTRVLDVKALKDVEINSVPYIVIGVDENDEGYFVVKRGESEAERGEIFCVDMELNSKANLKENTKAGVGWQSLNHCILFYYYCYVRDVEMDKNSSNDGGSRHRISEN